MRPAALHLPGLAGLPGLLLVQLLQPVLLTAVSLPARAATDTGHTSVGAVFRCEPAPGSPSVAVYSDQPCPRGQPVHTQDPRTRDQQRAAAERAQDEARWAQGMARQRAQDERLHAARPQAQPSVIGKEKVDITRNARSQALREADCVLLAGVPSSREGDGRGLGGLRVRVPSKSQGRPLRRPEPLHRFAVPLPASGEETGERGSVRCEVRR